MHKPTVLVVAEERATHAAVAGALKDVASVVFCGATDAGGVVAEYAVAKPSVVLVAVAFDPEGTYRTVAELTAAGAHVVVVSPAKDPDLILGAMRSGAREFLVDSDAEGLRRALRELERPDVGSQGGTVITLFPTRGGVGATCIATNLAHAMQRAGERVCLLDLDLHLGDVLSFLDLPGTYSITDVLSNMGRLDRDLLDASITRHASGIRVLAQSGKVEEADHVRPPVVSQLLGFLRRHYDCVLVDGIRGFDEMALAALDASQKILVILTQDVPAVRNAKRCLDLFRRLGYGEAKLTLVLNRFQKDPEITPAVIEETVGLPIARTLSNDFAAAIGSINRGVPLQTVAPRSRLTKDIDKLVPLLVEGGGKQARPGFFRTLLSRRNGNGAA